MGNTRRVTVTDHTGHVERMVEVGSESYVADLVRTGLTELNLPRNGPDGTVEYRARYRGRLVSPTDRVEDTLETEDDVVELIPEPTAG
jgi:hypothetical protein